MFGLVRKSKLTKEIEEKSELSDKLLEKKNELTLLRIGMEELISGIPNLPEKYNEVIETEQPYIAYKATANGIMTALIPTGARVVYPTKTAQSESSPIEDPNKYRVDELIPIKINSKVEYGMLESDGTINAISGKEYEIGKVATPNNMKSRVVVNGCELDTDTGQVCTGGLHVFAYYEDALHWYESVTS